MYESGVKASHLLILKYIVGMLRYRELESGVKASHPEVIQKEGISFQQRERMESEIREAAWVISSSVVSRPTLKRIVPIAQS